MALSISKYLRSRQLLQQCTSERLLDTYSHASNSAYLGIDPTAPSLHVGHLMGLFTLKKLKKFGGYRPIVLIGGATALIGDPSFKTNERPMLTEEFVSNNIAKIEQMLKPMLGEDTKFVNNRAWYDKDMTALELLRDVGRHFRVSAMLSREIVKARLDSGDGLSFTELSYQLLQANDFKHLYQTQSCRVQLGGSDQWGNILSGVEYIQRQQQREKEVPVVGVTFPLVTVGGVKLGKTTGNVTCWLDRELTSDFDFYQYFVKMDDVDSQQMLLKLTEETDNLDEARPQLRVAKLVTTFVRGAKAAERAEHLSQILFGGEPITNAQQLLDSAESAGVMAEKISRQQFAELPVFALAVKAGVCGSQSEAKRLIANGALTVC
ncbi:tyrosine-tRNA ligase [Batrachochytrium salamandrivorans]|nr:tyrosine-tRNA ligase [Batrachochytrium salamandrivorans]